MLPPAYWSQDAETAEGLTYHSGLGIGTAPSALVRHGIDTTVVEIDPLVTRLARQYFKLDPAVDVRDEDALPFVDRAVNQEQTYSYIIHDVFTGGKPRCRRSGGTDDLIDESQRQPLLVLTPKPRIEMRHHDIYAYVH